jgi:hypothetical protein
VPPKKKPRVVDLREVEKKIAQYKEHVQHDHRYKTVVRELEQARIAIRKGFDRLLAAVSTPARKKKPAKAKRPAAKRPKKQAARKRSYKRARPRPKSK